MKQIALTQLEEMFDPRIRPQIRSFWGRPGTTGIAVFENQQLDSRHCGKRTAVCFGPGCTYKTAQDIDGSHLYDLPSQRQYPVAYTLFLY